MSTDRFVVFGLGAVRAIWPTELARWSHGGEVSVEFLPCISESEIAVRVTEGRACSLALLEPGVAGVDRDLIRTLTDAGVPTVLIAESPTRHGDVNALGATAIEPPPRTPDEFQTLVQAHGRPIRATEATPTPDPRSAKKPAWQAPVIAVTGPPASGRSTIAAALAQHLAADPRFSHDLVLADLARRAHQALLHDAGDVLPALQDLVELHRSRTPGSDEVRQHLFDVPCRGYQLLLGLRHPSDWTSLRHDALGATLQGLRASTRLVICDVDAETAGETETGSFDIEDRNSITRTVLQQADVVVTIGPASLTGLHGLAHVVREHRTFGVRPSRQIVVINRAPRSPKARAELADAAQKVLIPDGEGLHHGLVFILARRDIETVHRDRSRFPDPLSRTLASTVRRQLDEDSRDQPPTPTPRGAPVLAGSLGLSNRVGRA